MFVAFNQNPRRQFQTIQERLIEEPMVDYITPVGGGYFFTPAGRRPGTRFRRVGPVLVESRRARPGASTPS